MEIRVEIDARAVLDRFGVLASQELDRALSAGLDEAGQYGLGQVVLEAASKGLQSRTGTLLNSIAWTHQEAKLEGAVGVPSGTPAAKYAYLLTEESRTIVPEGHPYLAIPIGGARTAAGVATFSSPRQVAGLTFRRGEKVEVHWGKGGTLSGLTAGIMAGEKYLPLFVLLGKTVVRGRDVIGPALDAARGTMTATVQERVDELIAAQRNV